MPMIGSSLLTEDTEEVQNEKRLFGCYRNGIFFWAAPSLAEVPDDVNNDGKVGLCEAVNALQTAVGVRHPIHLV